MMLIARFPYCSPMRPGLFLFLIVFLTTLFGQNLIDRLKKEDANGDGKVTREEFRGPPEVFKRLDANGDGVIDAEEMDRVAKASRENEKSSLELKSFEVIKDLPYATNSPAQKLDLVRPKNKPASPAPLVVFIHGGGWKSGDKSPFPTVLETLAGEGFVCVSINYRLSGEAKFPAQIEDCKAAIRFLKSKSAEFGLDPNRIGVWGSSAGGHLAALLGTSGDSAERVQAVCDFFGPTDFLKILDFPSKLDHRSASSPEAELLGGAVESLPESVKRANPISYISPDDPPFLIMHGDKDQVVPINQSELLFKALQTAGVPSRFVVVTNGGHGFRGKEIDREVVDFFKSRLLTKVNVRSKDASGAFTAPFISKGIFVSGPPGSLAKKWRLEL